MSTVSTVTSITSLTGAELRQRMLDYPGIAYATKTENQIADVTIGLLKDVWSASSRTFELTMTREVGVSVVAARAIQTAFASSERLSNVLLRRICNEVRSKEALKAYRESPAALRDIKRKKQGGDSEAGPFGPFLDYLSTVAEPAARAEMLAMLELYCESGWAFLDSTVKGKLSAGQVAIQSAFRSFEKGERVTPNQGFKALKQRMDELAIPLTIKSHTPKGKTSKDTFVCAWDDGGSVNFGRNASSGELDVCIPDAADPGLLHTASVSLKSRQDENNKQQAPRHRSAVVNALRIGLLRDRKSDCPFQRIRHTVFHAPVLYSELSGLQVNKALAKALPEERTRNVINFLSFLSAARGMSSDNSRCNLDDLLDSEQKPFSAIGCWNPGHISPNKRVASFGEMLVKAISALASVPTTSWAAQDSVGDVIGLMADAITLVANCFEPGSRIRNKIAGTSENLGILEGRLAAAGRVTEKNSIKMARVYVSSKEACEPFEPVDDETLYTTIKGAKRAYVNDTIVMKMAIKRGWTKGVGKSARFNNLAISGQNLLWISRDGTEAMKDLVFGHPGHNREVRTSISLLANKVLAIKNGDCADAGPIEEVCFLANQAAMYIEQASLPNHICESLVSRLLKVRLSTYLEDREGENMLPMERLGERQVAAAETMIARGWETSSEAGARLLLLADATADNATEAFGRLCSALKNPAVKIRFLTHNLAPSFTVGRNTKDVASVQNNLRSLDDIEAMVALCLSDKATTRMSRWGTPIKKKPC